MTGVILNADDYAMTRAISQAILALAEAGRLSSTSAIVTTGYCRRRPEEYAPLSRCEDTPALIWRPQRATDASGFPW